MNLLLFDREERQGKRLFLTGRRAEHIQKVLRLQPGDQLRLGEVNGLVGTGVIRKITDTGVELKVELTTAPRPEPDITLILALPRPIMLKRILKQATTLGVKKFHLIRTRRVEKSFYHSPVLKAENIRDILLQALEQAMDTRLPQVHIHKQFKPFVQDILPSLPGTRLLAHPGESASLFDLLAPHRQSGPEKTKDGSGTSVLLAVGPEGGFVDYECEQFAAQGFSTFTMGSRILHVDTAVVALLAQVQLLLDTSF